MAMADMALFAATEVNVALGTALTNLAAEDWLLEAVKESAR